MALRIAINGFGRIGRLAFRAILERNESDIEVICINDLGPTESNAHLLKYDSVHGILPFEVRVKEDHLLVGDIEYVEEEPSCALATGDQNLVRILEELIKHPLIEKLKLNIDYSNAVDVSYRLSELLPIDPIIKQSLLELDVTENRISELKKLINGFQK